MSSSDDPVNEKHKKITDALLIAWSYESRRFFVFSHIDPVTATENTSSQSSSVSDDVLTRRDHWNEAPDAAEAAAAAVGGTDTGGTASGVSATRAVLHTTMGDITVQLFGPQTPKTVENFATHARNGYYDNLLFHRVIKGFMLQTGDPNGDGTGGEVRNLLCFVWCIACVCVLMSYFRCVRSISQPRDTTFSFLVHFRVFGVVNLKMKLYLVYDMIAPLHFPWPMLVQVRMGVNSLLQPFRVLGWMANTLSLAVF
jgi:hypothetical protein